MLTHLLALAVMSQGAKADAPTPAQLVSRMLARYSGATSLVGKIDYTQTAGKVAVHGETILQYVRPDKLYILQTMEAPDKASYRVVSDGTKFNYSLPQDLPGLIPPDGKPGELVEPVDQSGKRLDLAGIYTIGSSGLVDKSVPLDIALGRLQGLKAFRAELASVKDEGVQSVDGVDAHIISGDWRQYDTAPVSGTYRLAITDGGDLLFYSIKELFADAELKMAPQEIVTAWRVSLKVDAPTDPSLFKR